MGEMSNVGKYSRNCRAAQEHAQAGFPVFPVNAVTKQPLAVYGPDGRGGLHAATICVSKIIEWWSKWPDASIATPTGIRFSVLDLDVKPATRKDGRLLVPAWESLTNIIVQTQNGGIHLYFRSEGAPRNTSDKLFYGVDTRGEGGYVLVPPSAGYTALKGTLINDWRDLPYWPQAYRIQEKVQNSNHQDDNYTETHPLWAYLAARFIENKDDGWEDWNKIGMAFWASTQGHEWGRLAWHKYSSKSDKYNAAYTEKRWRHWEKYKERSPPNQLSYGTLFYLARQGRENWQEFIMDILYNDQLVVNNKPTSIDEEARLLGLA